MSSIENVSRTADMSQIDRKIGSYIREKGRIEIRLLDGSELPLLQQRVDEVIRNCKEYSRLLKEVGKRGALLEKVKGCKVAFRILHQEILAKCSLLDRRLKLYGSTSLSSPPSFRTLLMDGLSHENVKEIERLLRIRFRVEQGKILRADLNALRAMKVTSESGDIFLRRLIKQWEDTFDEQIRLFGSFLRDFQKLRATSGELEPGEKICLYLAARMELDSPFNIPFDPMEQLDEVESIAPECVQELRRGYHYRKPVLRKKQFIDYLPPWEREARRIAAAEGLEEWTALKRIHHLRLIIKRLDVPETDSGVLIIGGGPSGLMHALTFSILGQSYQLVEKRESERQTRNNVITLGRVNPKDLNVLSFFGVIDQLRNRASFSHLKAYQIEVKIGDLEAALKETIGFLGEGHRMHFSHSVVDITRNGDQSIVHIEFKGVTQREYAPLAVIVADGAKSLTRSLLGIGRWKLAKTTQVAFSIYRPMERRLSFPEFSRYRIVNGSKVLLSMGKLCLRAAWERSTLDRAYANTVLGGPSMVFRVPSQDYVIRCLRREEQADNQQLLDRISILDHKLSKHQGTSKEHDLKIDRKQALAELQRNLGDRAQQLHPILDLATSMFAWDHRVQPMRVSENYLVNIDVFRAERTTVLVGKTPFFIRGDASHLTDPYCGFGGKTAIEECMADAALFSSPLTGKAKQIDLSLQEWVHGLYRDNMIARGLLERFDYHRDTEFFWRFVVLVVDQGVISEEEGFYLAKLEAGVIDLDQSFITEIANRLEERIGFLGINFQVLPISNEKLAQLALERSEEAGLLAVFQKTQEWLTSMQQRSEKRT